MNLRRRLNLLDDLDDVFVVELVILADLLRLVLDGRTPHERVLHLLNDRPMNLVAEVLHLKEILVVNLIVETD